MSQKRAFYLFGAIAGLAVLLLWYRLSHDRRIIDPPEPQVKIELLSIQQAIEFYVIDHKGLPPQAEQADAASWYHILSTYSASASWNSASEKANKFIDFWGNDYRFKITPVKDKDGKSLLEVKIWSCGRNRRDEQGNGDDIVSIRQISYQ